MNWFQIFVYLYKKMCHYRLIASVGRAHLEYVEFPEGTYKKLTVNLRTT